MTKTIGAHTCCVCGRDFPLYVECRYTVRDKKPLTIIAAISSFEPALRNAFDCFEPMLHDAFDCPHCGCQNLVGERLVACDATQDDKGGEEEDNTCLDTE